MAYTQTGPFTNNTAPGITSTFLNNIETWILGVDQSTVTTINGSTSGTAKIYQPLAGTIKLVIVQMNNFRNGSAGAQTLAIPTPFVTSCRGWNSGCGNFQVMKSGVAQTVFQLTSFNTGADNGVSSQTTLHQNWLWHMDTFFDTFSFNGSDGSTHNGQIVVIGI